MKFKKIVIVGGGTAGWMAAAALGKLLGKHIEVCLIESEEIGTIGVGEATIPLLAGFHKLVGIDESDFMRHSQATFKLGIRFENWGNIGDSYLHAFGNIGKDCWACSFHHFWRKSLKNGLQSDLGDFSLHQWAADANKFQLSNQLNLPYAYHFDAGEYAKFLRAFSTQNGVQRIEGRIVHVTLNEMKDIDSVTLASGDTVKGDFYIDCSGFRALLIGEALGVDYEDWTHWLPCDRAVVVQTENVGEPAPYTRAIAHEAGWQWRIPLQHRTGNGLVYSSPYLNDETAQKMLLDHIEGAPITEPRLIQFKTGRRLNQWHKNCASLGLSSGFLEPLESTSLYMVQSGLIRLMQLFPVDEINQREVDEYNSQSKLEFEYIRDFIILHYHVTQRNDSPFWDYCRTMDIPESLAKKIDLFSSNGRIFRENHELFFDDSWARVMTGQGIIPKGYHPIVDVLTDADLNKLLSDIKTSHQQTTSLLAEHQQFIDRYCKANTPG